MRRVILFLLLTLGLFAEAVLDSSVVKSETVEKLVFIETSVVPENAVKTLIKLKTIEKNTEEEKETKEMQLLVKPYADSLVDFFKSSNYENLTTKKERDLQKMQSEITIYLKQLEEWEVVLKERIVIYSENLELLKSYSSLWSQTHINSIDESAPQAILEHITSVIVQIESLSNALKVQYDTTLVNSQIVTTNMLQLKEIYEKLVSQEELVKNRIFFQNEPALFELFTVYNFQFIDFVTSFDEMLVEKYKETLAYIDTNPEARLNFFISSFFVALFISYFHYLYRKRKLFVRDESFEKKAFYFLRRPFSTFFILMILISVAIFTDKPQSFVEITILTLVIPITRILSMIIEKNMYKYMYGFFFLYILYTIDKNTLNYELESRMIMLLIAIGGFTYAALILKNRVLSFITYPALIKIGNTIFAIFTFLLVIAFISNVYGSVLLSNRIIEGFFSTLYTSIIFYTIYTILTGYVVIMLRRRMSNTSSMLDIYSDKVEKIIRVLIKIWMFSWWLLVVSKIVGAYPFIVEFRDDFLALSWQVSNTTISIQSIFDFLIIVVSTWMIARVTKTILEIEIFARFNFPRGFPTAVLTTVNYVIVIGGTIIAFSSLGVTAQQFALIFGALGVGIGFGLRNIIANFVSGIIMVFERPVQIGDTIEVDKTMGSVQSIGARSSVIKTFDGSEVIIPNADFIAKEIVNWTLSNEHRRKTVEFKVALGEDIEKVLAIMKEVAVAHPDTLKDPEPLATFQSFGEYYLSFKLYFWLSENLIVAPSDITISMYKRLQEEGVEMPVPISQVEKVEL